MDVNQINSQSHNNFKYVLALSAVTTIAVSVFSHTQPHTLSWKWPAGSGAITVLLGLTHLKLVNTRHQNLITLRERLSDINNEFAEAKADSLQNYSSVEYDQNFLKTCLNLDADQLTSADNELFKDFNSHIECQSTLTDLSNQLKAHGSDLTQFQQQLAGANEKFNRAQSFEECLAVEYDQDFHKICKALDVSRLTDTNKDLYQAYQKFLGHIDLHGKLAHMSELLNAYDLDIPKFRDKLTKANALLNNAHSFEELFAVDCDNTLYNICQKLEKAQDTHPRFFLKAHKVFAEHMTLYRIFKTRYIHQPSFITALRKAFDYDLDGFLKELLNKDLSDEKLENILKSLLPWVKLDGARMTQVKESKHWGDLFNCIKRLGLDKKFPEFKKEEE